MCHQAAFLFGVSRGRQTSLLIWVIGRIQFLKVVRLRAPLLAGCEQRPVPSISRPPTFLGSCSCPPSSKPAKMVRVLLMLGIFFSSLPHLSDSLKKDSLLSSMH